MSKGRKGVGKTESASNTTTDKKEKRRNASNNSNGNGNPHNSNFNANKNDPKNSIQDTTGSEVARPKKNRSADQNKLGVQVHLTISPPSETKRGKRKKSKSSKATAVPHANLNPETTTGGSVIPSVSSARPTKVHDKDSKVGREVGKIMSNTVITNPQASAGKAENGGSKAESSEAIHKTTKSSHKRTVKRKVAKTDSSNGKSGERQSKVKLPSPYAREFDFTDFVYTPHTLSALLVFVIMLLLMTRYYYYPHMGVVASVKMGLMASAMSFVVFGAIHLPDSLLVRPHPFVWRAVLAVALIYVALLSFLLFQDLKTVRTIMGFYDPSLLVNPPELQYAEDCRISTPKEPYLFFHTAFDVFILAHALGYFVKTLILRDWRVSTCVSIGFEIIEVTFQHVLPNFRECWWDHLLLDVLICNAGGTLLGLIALRFLRAKEFHWVELRKIDGYKKKATRILGQLGPRSFIQYEWNFFHSPRRFLQVTLLLALMFIQEINCFTMKHILHMPPKHHLVTLRLVMWSLIAMPSIREVYDYITSNTKAKRFGTTAWVGVLALLLETIFITKMSFEGKYFQEPMPSYIAIPWIFALILFVLWFVVYFGILSLSQRLQRRGVMYFFSNVLFSGSCLCVFSLFVMGMPDLQFGRSSFLSFINPYETYILWWRK